MGLVISLSKAEAERASALNDQLLPACSSLIEKDDRIIYVPIAGKVMDILAVFIRNNINYELVNLPVENNIE